MDNITPEIVLDNLIDGVYYVDRNARITYWNKTAEVITGYRKDEVIGRLCSDNILRHIDELGNELCLNGCPLAATLLDGQTRSTQMYLHHKQGHRVPILVRVTPVVDAQGVVTGGVEVFSNNADHLQILQKLELLKQEAQTDALTSTCSRRYGENTLQACLDEYSMHQVSFGVIALDVDQLKHYNDSYGHKTGDDILVMVSRTITGILRRLDTIARWGGDEFIVILPEVSSASLVAIAQRIETYIERSFIMVEGIKLTVTISIGASLGLLGDTVDSLMQRVDKLMYTSKSAGRNRITLG